MPKPKIIDDVKQALDPAQSDPSPIGPISWLWVYNPLTNSVSVEHNEGRHPAWRITHADFMTNLRDDNVRRGFAYRIKGGWRITTRDHKEEKDPYIVKAVEARLNGRPKPEPMTFRYHGLPNV